ncbi:MAG: hypothetical protein J0L72_08280 [Armatimonadetes bacterium]|nr:hypothetical protein [Armatimonadota bacterium]
MFKKSSWWSAAVSVAISGAAVGCNGNTDRCVVFDLTQKNYYPVENQGFTIIQNVKKSFPNNTNEIVVPFNRASAKLDFMLEPSIKLKCRTRDGEYPIFGLDDKSVPEDGIERFWITSYKDVASDWHLIVFRGSKSDVLKQLGNRNSK